MNLVVVRLDGFKKFGFHSVELAIRAIQKAMTSHIINTGLAACQWSLRQRAPIGVVEIPVFSID
jgi:hypothetical protein